MTARQITKTTLRTQGRPKVARKRRKKVNGEEQESARKTNAAQARTNRNVYQEFI